MDLVFVDLETTGGVASRDRITEIAIVRYRDSQEVRRWSALINPEQSLSPFIRKLTGLTDAMLSGEPLFSELASTLLSELQDAVFVAHNARFDYGFLKQEFARAGLHWQAQNLCTVKLSRALYPEYKKHGLDQLIERHQLKCEQRHRAMGDALATLQFFQHACDELGESKVMAKVEELLLRPALPPGLATDELDGIPATPGVFVFRDKQGQSLFMGHGRNLFQSITGRFQSGKGPDWQQEITSIDYQECAGEFSAQLLFGQRIQQEPPLHQFRRATSFCSIQLLEDPQGYLQPHLADVISPSKVAQHYGLFQSETEALKAVRGLAKAYHLAVEMEGVELPKDISQKPRPAAEVYNLKLQTALAGLKLKSWPWPGAVALIERERFTGICQCHLFENWCHISSTFGEKEEFELVELLQQGQDQAFFDKSIYQVLQKLLANEKRQVEIIPLRLS